MMIYTKYESSVVSDKKIFESCILNLFINPVTYLYMCNQSEPFEQFW